MHVWQQRENGAVPSLFEEGQPCHEPRHRGLSMRVDEAYHYHHDAR